MIVAANDLKDEFAVGLDFDSLRVFLAVVVDLLNRPFARQSSSIVGKKRGSEKQAGPDEGVKERWLHNLRELGCSRARVFSAVRQKRKGIVAQNNLRAVPGDTPPQTGLPPETGYVVEPEFVREMAAMALKGIEAYRQRACNLRALAIGADKDLARELAEGNGTPPGAIEVISRSLAEISQKYGWLSQWTPEVAIVIAVGTWAESR